MTQRQSPENVRESLIKGNQRFLNGSSKQSAETSLKKLKDFAENGQLPKAVILCCSDSRAPVEMIFDQDIGDLFVIRVAGNIVAPSLVGSVEFAATTLGVRYVLVMGHTHCGAIKATMDYIENAGGLGSENIHDIISRIKPHVFPIAQRVTISREEKLTLAVEANVMASVNQLSHSSRLIENLSSQNILKIEGAILDLHSGKIKFIEP